MKKFYKKLFIFLIPFIIWFLFVFIVDPYNYFNISKVYNDSIKVYTAMNCSEVLWKLVEFNNNPEPNILIGDSRINLFDPQKIYKITGQKYYNLAFSGTGLKEEIDNFWFASSKIKLKNVYMNVNFNLSNNNQVWDRVPIILSIVKNPFFYLTNETVFRASYYIVYTHITHEKVVIVPPQTRTKEEFWKFALEEQTQPFYSKYSYPTQFINELAQIADYCKINQINLYFIMCPTHVEVQRKISDYGLENEERKYKQDIINLKIPLYDFDYPNDLTIDKNNFNDPFHIKPQLVDELIEEIWQNKIKYAKYSQNQ